MVEWSLNRGIKMNTENKFVGFDKPNLSKEKADMIFNEVFGACDLMDKECYYDPLGSTGVKVDKRASMGHSFMKSGNMRLMKTPGTSITTTTGGTHTSYSLMPAFIAPEVVDQSVKFTPLVAMLARRACKGKSYVYDTVSAKGGASFRPAGANLASVSDTRSSGEVAMKFLYAVGEVLGPAQAMGRINLMAEDLRVKTASMNEALENEIINGNVSTNALGFNGLIASITTNSTSSAGQPITLEDVRSDMNDAFEAGGNNGTGFIDLVVTDGYTHGVLKGLLMDYQRNIGNPVKTMAFGIPGTFEIDGAEFIKDRFMPTTAGSRGIVYIDTRHVYLGVLQDYTYKEMGVSGDFDKYFIKWYGALVVDAEDHCAQRTSLE